MNQDQLLTEVFLPKEAIFGAYSVEPTCVVLVVEASSDVEALARVDMVAPLLGYSGAEELGVVQLREVPAGVATFLSAYFLSVEAIAKRRNIGPGTSTIQ